MDKDRLIQKSMDLLEGFDYDVTGYGIRCIIDEWECRKEKLLEAFRKHPNWDEERLAIVLPVELERKFNVNGIISFSHYLQDNAKHVLDRRRVHGDRRIADWFDKKGELYSVLTALQLGCLADIQNDTAIAELKTEVAARYYEVLKICKSYVSYDYEFVTRESYDQKKKIESIAGVVGYISSTEDAVINQNLRDAIVSYGFKEPHMGAKTSKVIRRLCQENGVFTDTERNDRGSLICEQRFAEFADCLNERKDKAELIISLNPLDFWTMSFGHNWSSCHTIDKGNTRPNNGSNHYHGCYSGGTESYMLDESTFIVYTGEMEDKIKRCNFHVSENGNLLCQGRVYPDGRDEGDFTLAPQFRHYVQEVISQCYEIPNEWIIKKGTSNCSDYVVQSQPNVNYEDFFHYNDCNVSVNKEIFTDKAIYVGSDIICPHCGDTHTEQEWITCYDCRREVIAHCDNCEDNIYAGDDYIHTEDGHYFCCEDCAEAWGYHRCYDNGRWYEGEDAFEDPYNGEWYHRAEVTTEDGVQYGSEDNAMNDGYRQAEDDGRWYRRSELHQHRNGYWYLSEEEEEAV